MTILRGILIALLTGTISVTAQTVPAGLPVVATQSYGSVEIKGAAVKSGTKLPLARKRFYLFSGGVKDNGALIERISAAQITSRDCYYTGVSASACLIDWLKEENCETPFCRKIEQVDIANISEFQTAYNKGLPLYGRKANIALDWVANNLPDNIAIGYFRRQRSLIAQILGGVRPAESAMTTAAAPQAIFANIAVGAAPVPVLVSNVLPVEVGNKSFVWICELNVTANKKETLALSVDPAKQRKGCTVKIRDLQVCSTEPCQKK